MYHQNAERLVRAGLRVVVIEQTETPEQLKARNDSRLTAEKKVTRHSIFISSSVC